MDEVYAMERHNTTKEYFKVVLGDTIENINNPNTSGNNNVESGSRPSTLTVESRPGTPSVEPISTGGSNSQFNTRDFHNVINPQRNFLYREEIHGYKYGSNSSIINPTLQTNYSNNSHIMSNVSNTINSSSHAIQSNLNPMHMNSTAVSHSTIMQNVAESSSQVQSNMNQITTTTEFVTSPTNPKPLWVEHFYTLEGSKSAKCSNSILKSTLPWYEVEVLDISKLTRPKIVAINFDFSHQNIEAIFQEFRNEKGFYVSNEHIPGLTPNNYKESIPDFYEKHAFHKPSIVTHSILIENGDARKLFIAK